MRPSTGAVSAPKETAIKPIRKIGLRLGLRKLGPGLITGAADDDPSGIATYSQAGAQFGYSMLWTVLFTLPLMAAIQIVSARIGYVTRRDLIATVPSYVIQRARARPMLKMLELPFPVPHFEVKQGWHQCNHDDVANRWLRSVTSERFTKT